MLLKNERSRLILLSFDKYLFYITCLINYLHLGYYFYDVICFDAQVKCEMYWPDVVREPKQYGEVVVNPISISQIDKYNINIFQVSVVRTSSVINFFFLFKMFFLYCSKIVSLYKSCYKQSWISLPGSRKVQLLV